MKRQRGVDVDIDVRAHLARQERVIGKAAATTNAAQVRLRAGRACNWTEMFGGAVKI